MLEPSSVFSYAAAFVLLVHALWIVWILLGSVIVQKFQKMRPWHLGSILLTLAIFVFQGTCPLTDIEVWLRDQAGESSYAGGFIVHYLNRVVYSQGVFVPSEVIEVGLILYLALVICVGYHNKLSITG